MFEGSPSAFLCLYLRVFVSSLYMFFEVDTVFNFQFLRVLCFVHGILVQFSFPVLKWDFGKKRKTRCNLVSL